MIEFIETYFLPRTERKHLKTAVFGCTFLCAAKQFYKNRMKIGLKVNKFNFYRSTFKTTKKLNGIYNEIEH